MKVFTSKPSPIFGNLEGNCTTKRKTDKRGVSNVLADTAQLGALVHAVSRDTETGGLSHSCMPSKSFHLFTHHTHPDQFY